MAGCNSSDRVSISSVFNEATFNALPTERKNHYLDSVLINLKQYKNDSIKSKLLFKISEEYYNLNNSKSSFETSVLAYETSAKLKDSFSMGRSLYYIGDYFREYEKDSAYYYYYKESEKIFRLLKNEDRLAKVHYNKAYLLFYEGNYTDSEIEVIKALQNLKDSNKYLTTFRCYSLQGSNHLELGEYKEALKYFDDASKVLLKMKQADTDKDAFYDYNIINMVNRCLVYNETGAYAKAVLELRDILKSNNLEQYPKLHYIVLGNLGYSLMKSGKYVESSYYLKLAIDITKKVKSNQGYLYTIIDLGENKLLTKDFMGSKVLFVEALALAKKLNSGKEELKILNFLAQVDPEKGVYYKSEYIRVNDSITKKQRESREKFTRIEYETNRIEDANEVLSNKNLLLLLGLSSTILLFLIIQIIRSKIAVKKDLFYRQQKEIAENEMLLITEEFQAELIRTTEQEQHRISKELHDGVVNQIYGIRMILGSLNTQSDEASQKKRLGYIKDLHLLETEIRTLSHNLNTNFFKNEAGFDFLIEQLIAKNNEIGKTRFEIDITDSIVWNLYSSIVRINIYRILQELLLNVNKYAYASTCVVSVNEFEEFLIISVKDDGVGFDVSILNEGIGLKNIKSRAKTINAELIIRSNPLAGVEVNLTIIK